MSKNLTREDSGNGIILLKLNRAPVNALTPKYLEEIEKELLLALMGIETNYGTYVGKMDILSSLATLSFDLVS